MKTARQSPKLVLAMAAFGTIAALGLAGCSDSGNATAALDTLYNDSTVTLDIAATAGDAIASSVETMAADEGNAGLSADVNVNPGVMFSALPANSLTTNRTRTCYDVNGAVLAGCTPASAIRKVVTLVTIDGNRTGGSSTTGGTSASWSGAVHRIANDTTTRNFTGSTEISRTHNNFATAHDTTTFTDDKVARSEDETARDTVKGVTWNMPRSSNPFPVSGSIVRVDSVHVSIVKANQTDTKDIVRTVEVDFPADSQGNVVLKINAKTCNLNLVTHVVSGCK